MSAAWRDEIVFGVHDLCAAGRGLDEDIYTVLTTCTAVGRKGGISHSYRRGRRWRRGWYWGGSCRDSVGGLLQLAVQLVRKRILFVIFTGDGVKSANRVIIVPFNPESSIIPFAGPPSGGPRHHTNVSHRR